MQHVGTIAALDDVLRPIRAGGKRIAFVPTMGALHEGHAACIELAARSGDVTVVSIFVNPTQFGAGEDLERYPKTLAADLELCKRLGCDVVFTPAQEEMYQQEQSVWVQPSDLAAPLCGRTRRNHFRGVCTVVAKLFNMVQPDVAVFGQKDAQQALVVRDMARQLDFAVELVVCPIARDADGLAYSSRNAYLAPADRKLATGLFRSLRLGFDRVRGGERLPTAIADTVRRSMLDNGLIDIEYVEVLDAERLSELPRLTGTVVIAAAVRVGGTRLIDNIVVSIPEAGEPVEAPLFPGGTSVA